VTRPGEGIAAQLTDAAARLAAAGVPSPEYDAAELLAHVLGTSRSRLRLGEDPTAEQRAAYEALLSRRAAREPLQHLTGTAPFRHVELAVGPGVFVPRPETELLAGWAVDRAREVVEQGRLPVVVDLCTGSGAIALSVVHEVPEARVHAVEMDEGALAWATRNLSGSRVDLRQGDMATAFPDLDGAVDVVACNPPYIPMGAYATVSPEARDHDPGTALWSGQDGLDAIRVLERVAARLLRRDGVVGCEHADAQGQVAPAVFATSGRWAEVRDHEDLAGRPRFLTARLAR
jgi:release factor glutamine methyltransferase